MDFPGLGGSSAAPINQQYMSQLNNTGMGSAYNQGYVAKSRMGPRPATGDSVRSKSQRSRGSHMSHKRRLEANTRKKPRRFNEQLDNVSMKSSQSRFSRKSHASRVSKAVSQHSRRPVQQQQASQANDYGAPALEAKKQDLIHQIE